MKKYLLLLAVIMIACLAGCGKTNSESNKAKSSQKNDQKTEASVADDKLNVEEIDWEVSKGKMSGVDVLLFKYTNNTKFTFYDLKLDFKLKDSTTQEQLSVFENVDDKENMKLMGANHTKVVPGESNSDKGVVFINNTYMTASTMEQYDLFEPDMMSIVYIGSDDKIHIGYYEYATGSFYNDTTVREKYEKSDRELAKNLPDPDVDILQISTDEEDYISYESYGVSVEDFNEYISKLKDVGAKETESDEDDFEGELNGHQIECSFNEFNSQLYIKIEE